VGSASGATTGVGRVTGAVRGPRDTSCPGIGGTTLNGGPDRLVRSLVNGVVGGSCHPGAA
jgi:hypothetical protein